MLKKTMTRTPKKLSKIKKYNKLNKQKQIPLEIEDSNHTEIILKVKLKTKKATNMLRPEVRRSTLVK